MYTDSAPEQQVLDADPDPEKKKVDAEPDRLYNTAFYTICCLKRLGCINQLGG
jgi:hypothetical protein